MLVSGLGTVHDAYTLMTDGGNDTVTLGSSGATGHRVENLVKTLNVDGGPGVDTLDVTDDTDFALNDASLTRASGGTTDLQNIEVANLVGGVSDNHFNATGWTGTGSLDGQGGNDHVVANDDTNYHLTNSLLSRDTDKGVGMALTSIEFADLTGGVSDNSFTITNFLGTTTLKGNAGVNRLYLTMTGGTVITLDTLVLAADVVGNAAATSALIQIQTTLDLGSATRGFNIADGTAAKDMIVQGVLFDGGVVKYGLGTLSFEGSTSNTFTGTTTVQDGVLLFGKIGGAFSAQGSVVVGDGVGAADSAVLRFTGGSNEVPIVTVTVNRDGLFDLNGFNQTIASLSMTGGDVKTGTGVLTLNGPVNGNANATPATISGILDLGGVDNRLFTIIRGPGGDDMVVSALIQDGGLVKSGTGILVFAHNNSYKGDTLISAGTLIVTTNGALGTIDKGTSVQAGATLAFRADNNLNVTYALPEALTITGGRRGRHGGCH